MAVLWFTSVVEAGRKFVPGGTILDVKHPPKNRRAENSHESEEAALRDDDPFP